MDPLLFEDLGSADAFPGRRDLDEYALPGHARRFVLLDERVRLLDRLFRVVRQPGVDLRRDAAGDDAQDAEPELDAESVDGPTHDGVLVPPGARVLARPAERLVHQRRVLLHLRRSHDQRRIRCRVPWLELPDSVDVAGVRDDDRHARELIHERLRHAAKPTRNGRVP
jgi:hypothetical protein